MKKLFLTLLVLSFLIGSVYIFIFCVHRVESGTFAVVEDNSKGSIIRVIDSGYNLVFEGIFPDQVSIVKYGKRNIEIFDLVVPIPSLEELKSRFYSVIIPVSLTFIIEPGKVSVNFFKLKHEKKYFRKLLKKILAGYYSKELSAYFVPIYRKAELEMEIENITKRVYDAFISHCSQIGIEIKDMRVLGNAAIPELSTYLDGINYYREIRELEKNNKKELIKLGNKIKRNKIGNTQFYSKLKKISRLIKDNPDLLKYIYINKMADNVKVIVTPDKSGMPFGLDFNNIRKEKNKRDEIDNLR